MTADRRADLFAALSATWLPAEARRLGAWTLRRGEGGGNRVSAATLDAGDAGDIAAAEAGMRAWGQEPLFMVRPGEAALDAALTARGYVIRDPVILLEAPPARLAFDAPQERVVYGPAALAVMNEIWEAGGIGAAKRAAMARVEGQRTYLLGRLGDRPAGCGFAALHGAIAMLHGLEVAAATRRQGVGTALVRGAATWAAEVGAASLALAVTEANATARELYARLGMTEAARYHYRLAPPTGDR
jgi:GNAT superfamily N-acetyltransferase